MTTPAWTVVGCARELSARQALMVADAALRRNLCTLEELEVLAPQLRGTHGIGRVRWVIDNADPAAESPGETWTRLVLRGLGYAPRSQVEIRSQDFLARVDFLLGETLIVEFDGAVKYQGPEAMNEKRRQARLEALGYRVLRVVWDQLADPDTLDRRLQAVGAERVTQRKPALLLAG